MLESLLRSLDASLREHAASVYADLRPGTKTAWTAPSDLRSWFAWRNGQPHDTQLQLIDTYSFVSYDDAKAELSMMRRCLWQHTLQSVVLALFSRRSFYTLPLLTDVAGDGYCYHLIRRRPYYRFKGERDVFVPDFDSFVRFLVDYVSQPSISAGREFEGQFLERLYR